MPTDPANADFLSKKERDVASQLGPALTQALGGEVIAHPEPTDLGKDRRPDLLLTFSKEKEEVVFAVEFLRHAYPRDIRDAVWHLEGYRAAVGSEQKLILLVAGESLSPGAKQLLRERGIGYFEANGTLYLNWRHWLVNIERPKSRGASQKSEINSLFTHARENVVHALLMHRHEWMTGKELARLAGTSSFTCSVVLQELVRREWCEIQGAGRTLQRRLAKPDHLLQAWADRWVQRKESRSLWYIFAQNPNTLLTKLTYQLDKAKVPFPWAFTGTAAANIYAPLLTSVDTAEIIIPPGHANRTAKSLQLQPAEKGGNVTLVERTGASFQFLDMHPEYPAYFASPFILYLDALKGSGRSKELAKHVLERIGL